VKTKQPPPNEAIATARALLAEGKASDAQNLLLEEGYVKRLEPATQQAYLTLIPVNPTLQQLLDEVYPKLSDPSPKVRLDAATKLSREFSKEVPRDNVRWMRDPRASEPVIAAVSDADPKVSERAVGALARLVCRYFPDQRALPAFVAKLADRKQLARSNAITGIGCLRQEAPLAHLVELSEHGTDDDRLGVASAITGLAYESWHHKHLHPIEWTAAGRSAWIDRMIAALRDPHAGVRRQAANALNYFGDPRAIPPLRAARAAEPEGETTFYAAYYIDEAIKALEQRQ
jgi:HEAT repeat protein